jgi:hypothetical protein
VSCERKVSFRPPLHTLDWVCSPTRCVRQTNYYLAQGRAFRRVGALFDGIEDLVSENDRRYDIDGDEDGEAATVESVFFLVTSILVDFFMQPR